MIKKFLKGFGAHSFLITMSFLSLFPYLWLISTALKGIDENIFAYPPYFIPKHFTLENFTEVWKKIPFLLYFLNSFIVLSSVSEYKNSKHFYYIQEIIEFQSRSIPSDVTSTFRNSGASDLSEIVPTIVYKTLS